MIREYRTIQEDVYKRQAGDLLLGGRDLTKGLGVVGDIRQDDQHVHALFKGQVLGSGQSHTGRGDTLHGGVVGQVGEQHGALDGAGALELADEEDVYKRQGQMAQLGAGR